MAVFQKEGKTYAVPIGFEAEGQYKIYSDEMFFVEDPHDLYKHWPADVWQAVDQHEVKPGMNEMQADFAIGMGVPDSGASTYEKTVRYPNGGKPLVVVYHAGKAAEIKAGSRDLKLTWRKAQRFFASLMTTRRHLFLSTIALLNRDYLVGEIPSAQCYLRRAGRTILRDSYFDFASSLPAEAIHSYR